MPKSNKPGRRRTRQRRSSVSIGGVSQSAFAGYATTGNQQKPGTKPQKSADNAEQDDSKPSEEK